MKIGDQIKKKRKEEKISVPKLAALLGLKQENIYKWERGSKPSDPEEFEKVKKWLSSESGTRNLESVPNLMNEPVQEYSTSTLQNLAASNRMIAESNKGSLETVRIIAESNSILARSNEKLVNLVEARAAIADDDRRTLLETAGTLLGLRDFVKQMAVQQTKKPASEIDKLLDSKVKAAMGSIEHTGTVAFDGK